MRSAGLIAGMMLASVAWLGLIGVFVVRGHPLPWFSVLYNVPISLVFSGLFVHCAYSGCLLGPRRFAHAYGPLVLVWTVGAVVLVLRLVTKTIDVSGHMAWLVMMGVQCLVQHLPLWFTVSVWAVGAQVLVLKLFVLGGHSGQTGLVVGGLLGAAVGAAARGRQDLDSRVVL